MVEQQSQAGKFDALLEAVAIGIQQADKGDFVEFDARSIVAEARSGRQSCPASRDDSRDISSGLFPED